MGIILGTAAYMRPEQARGRASTSAPTSGRSALVLFEMLTGAPAFSGESTTDILADVVKKDPDWHTLPPTTPGRLIDTLKRCLQKNPKDRARDIADVRFEIEQSLRAQPVTAAAAVIAPRRSPVAAIAWFAAGAALAAAAALILMPRRDEALAPVAVRSTIVLPPDTSLNMGRGSSVALSPNGQLVAFTGRMAGVERMKAESERDSYSSELDALNETLADADHMTHGDDYRRIHDAVVTIVDDLRRDNEVLDHLARFHDDNHAGARYFCAEEPCSYLRQHADVNLHLDVA